MSDHHGKCVDWDLIILLDVNQVGVSQATYEQVTFTKEFSELYVIYDTEDGKLYDGIQLKPIVYRESFLNAWYERTVESIGVDREDLSITLEVVERPTFIGRTVVSTGIVNVQVRFMKSYRWGRPSPGASMKKMLTICESATSDIFKPYFNPLGNDPEEESKFSLYNFGIANPWRTGVFQSGFDDERPPTVMWWYAALAIQGGTVVLQFFIAVLVTRFGWSLQLEDYGDVRLSATYGKSGSNFRMKWPTSVLFITSLFRLELFAELWECLMTGDEHFGFILLHFTGALFQSYPTLLLLTYMVVASGLGISFSILVSMCLHVANIASAHVLWERSNAYAEIRTMIKLDWDASVALRWQMIAAYRPIEALTRSTVFAMIMTLFGEFSVLYFLVLDATATIIGICLSACRQKCRLGGERVSIPYILMKWLTWAPVLFFTHVDVYMGRSIENAIINPAIHYTIWILELLFTAFLWNFTQVKLQSCPEELRKLWVDGKKHNDWSLCSEATYGLTYGPGPNSTSNDILSKMMAPYPLDVSSLLVLSIIMHGITVLLYTILHSKAGEYYMLSKRKRRFMWFCFGFHICHRVFCQCRRRNRRGTQTDGDLVDEDELSVQTESTETSEYRYFVDKNDYVPKEKTPGPRDEKGRLLSGYYISPELLEDLTGIKREPDSVHSSGSESDNSGSSEGDAEADDSASGSVSRSTSSS